MELRARLIEYERGSRMKRQLTLGGASRMKLQVLLVDAATNEIVHSFTTEGKAYSAGMFGGSQESVQAKAMLDVANDVVKELQKQR